MNDVGYPYGVGDLLEDRQSYTYTEYRGQAFLDAWRFSRAATASNAQTLADTAPPDTLQGVVPTGPEIDAAHALAYLGTGMTSGEAPSPPTLSWLRWFIKRFEVSKRVHSRYLLEEARVRGIGDYRQMELYLRLAEVLAVAAVRHNHLPSLNALLKCVDTLCSSSDRLDSGQGARLARVIEAEAGLVTQLQAGSRPAGPADSPCVPTGKPAFLPRVTLLAADTLRSRGYAQALLAHGFRIGRAVIVKTPGDSRRWGQSNQPPPSEPGSLTDYFVPDLRIGLEESCKALAESVEALETGTINCQEVVGMLAGSSDGLVIYSGFGGEIVSRGLLERAPPFLHMHAGWLPDYRGSTTVFYSWLKEGNCGVSAILLRPEIDEGPIVARKHYPAPSAGMNVDYVHDSVIRADLLVSVMQHYAREGELPQGLVQTPEAGETYYIIHPVLKHVAMIEAGFSK